LLFFFFLSTLVSTRPRPRGVYTSRRAFEFALRLYYAYTCVCSTLRISLLYFSLFLFPGFFSFLSFLGKEDPITYESRRDSIRFDSGHGILLLFSLLFYSFC